MNPPLSPLTAAALGAGLRGPLQEMSMQAFRRKTLFAATFLFAAGFASTVMAHDYCQQCLDIYDACMQRAGTDPWICAREHNLCAQPLNCRVLPE